MTSTAVAPEALESAESVHLACARVDPSAFMSYVMRDERLGMPLRQAPIHTTWQDVISKNDRVLIWAHIESGKTNQISIGRTLWELGRDPTLRAAIVSNTHEQAAKIVRAISRYIESSAALHQVFPKLKPAEPWTATQLFVRRDVVSKDPSVQATGVHGNITGARIDLLVLDDVLDYENTRTPGLRQDLWEWYHATLTGRLTERSRVCVVGTAYHPEDILHRLAKQEGWLAYRYPVVDAEGKSRWPERWNATRIEKKRAELGPLEFARQMLCQARDDAEARFKREWINTAIHRGAGKALQSHLSHLPAGHRTYTGVDLGVQKHRAAGNTVLFTIMVYPNGDREVLWVEAGKWSGPEIVDRIIDAHRRFMSIIVVENNAAQDYIVQFTRGGSAVPIRPFTTGRNKANPDFGIESMAVEMAGGKWIIPNESGVLHPVVAEWVQEMLYYDPNGHTGDRLMASWFAREGARMATHVVEMGRLDLMSR